jgi:wyosine [tRNA(Phe)-imidazoG37] synthetase (radical SAM superfamily)
MRLAQNRSRGRLAESCRGLSNNWLILDNGRMASKRGSRNAPRLMNYDEKAQTARPGNGIVENGNSWEFGDAKRTGDLSKPTTVGCSVIGPATAFGCPMDFLENRFVYVVVSPRARGLSVGVDLNPDKSCNYKCIYCEINRAIPAEEQMLDTEVMAVELARTLEVLYGTGFKDRPYFKNLAPELMKLRHVTLSGSGEPTLSPVFGAAVEAVAHVRARGTFPFFKLVLVTNGTGLERPEVKEALKLLTPQDEIWFKLEAGTDAYMQTIDVPDRSIEDLTELAVRVGRERPLIIQSLFPAIDGQGPSDEEIQAFADRLASISKRGGRINLVQIYSATRPTPAMSRLSHLPLKRLNHIAQVVRKVTGLRAEVF